MVLVLLSGDPPIRRVKIVHIYDSSSVNNFFGIKRGVFFFFITNVECFKVLNPSS